MLINFRIRIRDLFVCMHSWRDENFSFRGEFSASVTIRLLTLFTRKGAKNTEDRVDLGSIQVRND